MVKDGGTIGIKLARIALLDANNNVLTGDKGLPNATNGIYTVTPESDGGMVTANITGLSPSINRLWGGDQMVAVSIGKAQPSVSFATNFLNFDVLNRLVGATQNGDSYTLDGGRVPAALDLISTSAINQKAYHFGFFRGYFTRGDVNLQTNTENQTRGTDQLTFTPFDNKDGHIGVTMIAEKGDYGKVDQLLFGGRQTPKLEPTPTPTPEEAGN